MFLYTSSDNARLLVL